MSKNKKWSDVEFKRAKNIISASFTKEEAEEKLRKTGRSLNAFSHIRRKKEGMSGFGDLLQDPIPEESKELASDKSNQKLGKELSKYKAAYKKAVNKVNLQDEMIRLLKQEILPLPTLPIPELEPQVKGSIEETVVLLYSDQHVGEVTLLEETGGLFEYNFDIFRDRVACVVDKTIKITKTSLSEHVFDKLVVVGLGDTANGTIHQEIKENSDLHVVDQAIAGGYVTARMLMELAREFPKIEFYGLVGNHGRLTKEVYYSGRSMNWDTVHYTVAASLCKDQENIKFHVPRNFYTKFNIRGYNFVALHGDGINVGSYSGSIISGIEKGDQKLTAMEAALNKEAYDYMLLGHFHNCSTVGRSGSGEIFINSSFPGGDTYSVGRLMKGGDPVQFLFGVHKDHGASWRFPLVLKDAPKIGKERYPYDERKNFVDQMVDLL